MSAPPPPVPAPVGVPSPRLPDDVPDLGPPPPRKGLSTLAIVLIVCGVLAIPCLAGLIGTVAVVVPQMQAKQMRFACQQNLSQLAAIHIVEVISKNEPKHSGPAYFLEWRKHGRNIRSGQEAVLLCPRDPAAVRRDTPEWRARWDDVDLDDPAPGLCSYAVRDFATFPIERDSMGVEPIAACLHHTETGRDRGGATVAFSDGSVRWIDYEELGISDASELVVGPDSKAELLRPLTLDSSSK